MKRISLQAMIEASIFAAMALVLDLLPSIKPTPSISISFAMVPIFIVAFRWGIKTAFISGLLWGLLQIAIGDYYIVTPLQGFIEYFIAFSFIGFAGLLAPAVKKLASEGKKTLMICTITIGVFLGSLARYFWHFIAGVIFFAKYAYEAGKTPIVFSFIMNGTTMIFSFLLCTIVICIVMSIRPELIKTNKRDISLHKSKAS
ncbi:energy-coupled thiamine transporter ThiT [Lederbergia lenta]|uniref:energy-coupled thiamine transporter ThiT n=1 Tax=Lederbergia lenta TaxID=1467 RepID=UPI0020409917|nr:energy-coupled thiamine transporter ThiT [Lederbergia lenta]MCM3109448.1 energy-coupled thiamine transporter ThiT [Lederbergia lenta]